MPATFLATLGRVLWRLADAHDLDADFIFRDSGLDPTLIKEPHHRYPFDRICDACVKVAKLTDNPQIGLEAAKYYRPLDFHALGVTFLSSSTLLDALKRFDRYESVMNSEVDYSIIETTDGVDFICEGLYPQGDAKRIVEDARMAMVVDLCRMGVGNRLDPQEVAFTFSKPRRTRVYSDLFRCPVKFAARTLRISFSAADVQRPFTAENRDLARGNDQILDRMLKNLQSTDIVSRAKQAIVEELPSGTPTESNIAKTVFTSPRTLSRRLAEMGTNFRKLLTEVRQELAEQYVADPTISITEISYLLGFSDISSFSRAFKRWAGESPVTYRAKVS